MKCPVCHLDQVIVEFHDVELDMCIEGCGTWFDADELQQLFEAAGIPRLLHDLESRLQTCPPGSAGPTRRCPRCHGRMLHVRAPGSSGDVILDRCRRGHGLWFDEGELADVIGHEIREVASTPGAEESSEGEDAGGRALATVRAFLGQFVQEAAAPSTDAPSPEDLAPPNDKE